MPKPPTPAPTIDAPFPDAGHEAIRQWVLQGHANSQANAAGIDDTYSLADLLFGLLGTALTAIDDLTARVTKLEAAVFPPPAAPTLEMP